MKTVRVIPCLDVDAGRVVKGVNFVGLRDAGDPVELAAQYDTQGADEIVFLDITASSDNREIIIELAERAAEEVFIPFTNGGGIRSVDDARRLLRAGADKVSINTAALSRPSLITESSEAFGNQCIVISIDARRRFDEYGDHYAKINGESCWFECTIKGGREGTGIDVVSWVKTAQKLGAGEIFVNSIDADGTKDGYDIPLTKSVCDSVSTPVIASSGCGSPQHMYEVFANAGANAALAASIFHFDEYTITETKEYLQSRGIPIRL